MASAIECRRVPIYRLQGKIDFSTRPGTRPALAPLPRRASVTCPRCVNQWSGAYCRQRRTWRIVLRRCLVPLRLPGPLRSGPRGVRASRHVRSCIPRGPDRTEGTPQCLPNGGNSSMSADVSAPSNNFLPVSHRVRLPEHELTDHEGSMYARCPGTHSV